MRIALLNTKDTSKARFLLGAFALGAAAHGDECVWIDSPTRWRQQLDGCQVGVQVYYPNLTHVRPGSKNLRVQVASWFTKRRQRILTIDTGFLNNQSELEQTQGLELSKWVDPDAAMRGVYYALGFDGIKNWADYGTVGRMPADRWQSLGIPLRPWRPWGEHILLVGQTPHGVSTQHLDVTAWYAQVIKELRRTTQRTILFRYHWRTQKPRAGQDRMRDDRKRLFAAVGNRQLEWSKVGPLVDDLKGAWAAVALTSNAAVRVAVEGIPLFVGSQGCMAIDVASMDLASIEQPLMPKREYWAHRLSYCQWNTAELENGTAWRHLRDHACQPPVDGRPR